MHNYVAVNKERTIYFTAVAAMCLLLFSKSTKEVLHMLEACIYHMTLSKQVTYSTVVLGQALSIIT